VPATIALLREGFFMTEVERVRILEPRKKL